MDKDFSFRGKPGEGYADFSDETFLAGRGFDPLGPYGQGEGEDEKGQDETDAADVPRGTAPVIREMARLGPLS